MRYDPILVVGSGVAGLWTSWRLAQLGRDVVLLTKSTLEDSASAWAQGGVAAAVHPADSPAQHAADTLAVADGLADAEAVRVLTTEGPERIRDLLHLGAAFDRVAEGELALALEAGHSRPRVLHAGGDRTGAEIVRRLVDEVCRAPRIRILERTEARALLTAAGRVAGVEAGEAGSASVRIPAAAVVLATGGVGQLYEVTTNPLVCTGDGWALAGRVGARLEDLEFLQFHPTALKAPGANPAPLISEAVRGAGALLVDAQGTRFAAREDPRAELAPRDVLARLVGRADADGGAWLDARAIPEFVGRFPGIHRILAGHGLDPARDLVPVAPALHYAMGGIATDLAGRASVDGLWAVGEAARTGVHGANRLASNSLLEGLVFANRAAVALAQEAPAEAPPIGSTALDIGEDREVESETVALRRAMRALMTRDVGLERSEASLLRAEHGLARLEAEAPTSAWRLRMHLEVACRIARAALARRESRGGHRRIDHPGSAAPGRRAS